MGKASVVKGGLAALGDAMKIDLPDASMREKLMNIAMKFWDEKPVSKTERLTLRDYLRNEGANTAWKDMFPGARMPTAMDRPLGAQQVAAPKPGEIWHRGGPANLKLEEPVFTTRQPEGAAWFAAERSPKGIGAVGQYNIDAQNPARLRDLFRIMAENPGLEHAVPDSNYNSLDWLYSDEFRDVVKREGYDSALATDALERGEIDALVGLDKAKITPLRRSLVSGSGNELLERVKRSTKPFDEEGNYTQIGPTLPFSRKAKGGLVRMKECNCG